MGGRFEEPDTDQESSSDEGSQLSEPAPPKNSREEPKDWDSSSSEATSDSLSPEAVHAEELRREEIRKGKAKQTPSPTTDGPSPPPRGVNSQGLAPGSSVLRDALAPVLPPSVLQGQISSEAPPPPARAGDDGGSQQLPSSSSAEWTPGEGELVEEGGGGQGGAVFIPWGRDSGRAFQKLPIRFRDCLGRTFLFPWEKAQTWKGTKRLINEALGHIDDIGIEVKAGHYDLIAWEVWDSEQDASINPKLTSYDQSTPQPQEGESSSSAPEPGLGSESGSGSESGPGPAEPPPPGFVASVENGSGSPTKDMGVKTRNAVILPELWELVIEPGMLISMVLWPWKKKKKKPPGNPSSSNSGWSSFGPSGQMQTITVGTGRGRGGGGPVLPMGRGRGAQPPPPPPGAHPHPQPHMPHPPPGPAPPGTGRGAWQILPPPRASPNTLVARGVAPKTRKRQGR